MDDDDKDLFDHLMEGGPVSLLTSCQEHLLSIHFHTQEYFSLSPSMKYHKYHWDLKQISRYQAQLHWLKIDMTTYIFAWLTTGISQ